MAAADTPAALPKSRFSGVGVRLLTAVGLLLLCIAPFYFGGWFWAVLVAALSSRMMYEWVRMSDEGAGPLAFGIAIGGLLIALLYAAQGLEFWAMGALIVATLAAVGERLGRGGAEWSAIGMPYIIVPSVLIVLLRGSEVGFDTRGFTQLAFIIAIVVAADVGAFFGGKQFGGPKLAPTLSPNKTWSGAVCGMLFAIVLGTIVGWAIGVHPALAALLVIPLVVLSVSGDLLESTFKRKLGVKDTGSLLPGHGGLLDRLDSLMAAVVGGAFLLLLVGHHWPVFY